MAIVMLALLMIQLQSFSRLALVFVTAPLGLIGATGALLISNRPFGFVALLGLIALAGMIMRNTVILVDQIDHDIAAGHGRYRAIIDATVRRARPVRADRARRHPRHDPARAQHLLGSDGDHHHGRPAGRDGPDACWWCRRSTRSGSGCGATSRSRRPPSMPNRPIHSIMRRSRSESRPNSDILETFEPAWHVG